MEEFRKKMDEFKAQRRALAEAHPGFAMARKHDMQQEAEKKSERLALEEEKKKCAFQLRRLVHSRLVSPTHPLLVINCGGFIRASISSTNLDLAHTRMDVTVEMTTGKVLDVRTTADNATASSALCTSTSRFTFFYKQQEARMVEEIDEMLEGVLLADNHRTVVCDWPEVKPLQIDYLHQSIECEIEFRFAQFPFEQKK
jgi:hypothetical protein